MPELPEVETTVRGLRRIVGYTITRLWTDWPKYFKLPKNEAAFRKRVLGKKITAVERRGKNVLIRLDSAYVLLIHQKLSGHLMVGDWFSEKNKRYRTALEKLGPAWRAQKWVPKETENVFADDKNRFIRLVFSLKTGGHKRKNKNASMLALSDLRRFAKLMCGTKNEILRHADLATLGPEPLEKNFTRKRFAALFEKRSGPVKKLLLDQTFLSGVGNIYADESLWRAKIHPLRHSKTLSAGEIAVFYRAIRTILKKAVEAGGTSMDDYRAPNGKKGMFEERLNAYHRENKPCPRCKTSIKRIKIGARSAHFCPGCQTT